MKALLILLSLLAVSLEAVAQNWFRTNGPVEDDVHDLCIDSNGILYAVTPLGVNRSTDGGEHWTRPFLFPQGSLANHVFVALNGSIIATANTGIFVLTEGGDAFARRFGEVGTNLQFAVTGSGRIFASSNNAFIVSDDHGATWKTPSFDGMSKDQNPRAMAAAHDTIIAHHSYANVVFYSVNNGDTWQSQEGLNPSYVQKLMIHPDGSWLAILRSLGLYRKPVPGHSWDFFWFVGDTYAADIMRDGSIFFSTKNGLTLYRDLVWTDVTSGFDVDSSNLYYPVTRVVEDPKRGIYYAATLGSGVWKSKTTLRTENTESLQFTVSPNPFTDRTTIHFTEATPSWAELELRNILGAVVWKQGREFCPPGTNTLPIADHGLPPGNYLLVLRTSERTETQWVTIVQ